jgi:hypothetical protein
VGEAPARAREWAWARMIQMSCIGADNLRLMKNVNDCTNSTTKGVVFTENYEMTLVLVSRIRIELPGT